MSILDSISDELQALDAASLKRVRRQVEAVRGTTLRINGREILAFCSNDYLGLSQHPEVIEAARRGASTWGTGSTASPLVCGHSASHEALEHELARFVGMPRALYFGAGFAANSGLVPALAGRGDELFCDALNHASLIDGARLSRAQISVYPHGDVAALAALMEKSTARRKLILTDSVFSMDGDIAALAELLQLAEAHDALLVVDDAHGFGVLGPQGRGALAMHGLASPRIVLMGTLSKAAGSVGAFVAGDARIVELVMQRARSYVFATGAPAMITEALRASLRLIEAEEWRRERLVGHVRSLRAALAQGPFAGRLLESSTAIQPLIVGENDAALRLMADLWDQGLWAPAIRPPTVPAGTARLRITLSAAHADEDVERLAAALRGR